MKVMSNETFWDDITIIINDYDENVRSELDGRWEKWEIDFAKLEMHEAIGALLARQVTLATQIARAPSIWNPHVAPIILRVMVDAYITLAWIFEDAHERSIKYILYGLGQEKLNLEHRKAQLEADGFNPSQDILMKYREEWLNAQRATYITEVSVGSWSGVDTRAMANEAGCLDIYRYAYTPFSAAVHNMWNHVGIFNLKTCNNPLHRYHKVPIDPDIDMDIDNLYRAAKYVFKTFKLFDEKTGIKHDIPSAFEKLLKAIDNLEEKYSKKA
jgi:hypothetical protein